MEVYVNCPFCYRVYDRLKVPSVKLQVDRAVRFAHVECLDKMFFHSTQSNVAPLQKEAAE